MRTYIVKPEDRENILVVEDGTVGFDIPVPGGIGWGKQITSEPGATNLARAILADHLGDMTQALLLAQRFKWRTIKTWNQDRQEMITAETIKATITLIEEAATSAKTMVAAMDREKPQYTTDRAGPNQEWKTNPDVTPNKPEDAKYRHGKPNG